LNYYLKNRYSISTTYGNKVTKPKKWNNKNQKDVGYLNNDFNKFANISLLHKSSKTSSTSKISGIQIDTINFF